jgi:hypothetical protein
MHPLAGRDQFALPDRPGMSGDPQTLPGPVAPAGANNTRASEPLDFHSVLGYAPRYCRGSSCRSNEPCSQRGPTKPTLPAPHLAHIEPAQ